MPTAYDEYRRNDETVWGENYMHNHPSLSLAKATEKWALDLVGDPGDHDYTHCINYRAWNCAFVLSAGAHEHCDHVVRT